MVSIRAERAADHDAIHRVIARAFGRPDEADLVAKLRRVTGAVQLSMVAEIDGAIAAHVMLSPVTFTVSDRTHLSPVGSSFDGKKIASGLAPVSVDPAHQRKGVGTALVRAALDALDPAICVVLGDPDYYRRFGFVAAFEHHVSCIYTEAPPGAFQIRLARGVVPPAGLARYHPLFEPPVENPG